MVRQVVGHGRASGTCRGHTVWCSGTLGGWRPVRYRARARNCGPGILPMCPIRCAAISSRGVPRRDAPAGRSRATSVDHGRRGHGGRPVGAAWVSPGLMVQQEETDAQQPS